MAVRLLVAILIPILGCQKVEGGGDDGALGQDAAVLDLAGIKTDAILAGDFAMAGANDITVAGGVTGANIPNSAKTVVAWVVTSGSPDYLYKFGDGTSSAAKFMVTCGSAPPADAINSYGVGVGLIALLPNSAQIPDGKVDEKSLELLGISGQYAVIWRAPTGAGLTWSLAFPIGYSCGVCVPPAEKGFASFKPVECSQVQIDTAADASKIPVCNWT